MVCSPRTYPIEASAHRAAPARGGYLAENIAAHHAAALLPIMGAVLLAFLIIGVALPVLPLHVHHGLGLSTFVVGLVTGSQFAAAVFSRVWAGQYSDRWGGKRAVVAGLLTATLSGLF